MSTAGRWAVVWCCASLTVGGCAIRLVSEYDEATDRGVTQLQSDVAAQLTQLKDLIDPQTRKPKHPDCEFDKFSGAYSRLAASAHVLVVRNEARQKNTLTTEQLKLLESSIGEELVTVHRESDDKCMNAGAIQVVSDALDQNFRAILKLELAKKLYRGEG